MFFKRKPAPAPQPLHDERGTPTGIPEEWYLALCRTFPRGARWSHNPEKNEWLRKQYEAGCTPKEVRARLHVIPM